MSDGKIRKIEFADNYMLGENAGMYVPAENTNPNSVLENDSNLGQFDSTNFFQSDSKKQKVKQALEKRINEITQKVELAKKQNGILRKGVSWLKNNLLDFMSNSTDDVLKQQKKELDAISGDNIEKIFSEITGADYTEENIEKFLKGEILTKSEIALDKYKTGQEGFTEFGSDIASGWLATITYTAIGAAVAAAGAPVAAVVGCAMLGAAALGAGSKIGAKALAANNAGVEYDSLGKDTLVGGINGIFAPLAAIGGGKIASKLVTKLGGTASKLFTKGATEVIEEGVEQATQKGSSTLATWLNPYGFKYGGSNAVRALGYTTEFGVGGCIGGAIDASVRTTYDGGSVGDVLKSAATGAAFGTVGGISFGWGLKGLGTLWHNKGYNKGLEFKGAKSVNDDALIEAGANPAKRYKLPKKADSSGYLNSGIPIMDIARFLGAKSNYATIDDVMEDYIIHRFHAMKKYTPEQYRDFMQLPKGKANPLYDIEISPRTFIEDVLFQDETLSPFDMMEYQKFKSKLDLEDVRSSLEILLSGYEIPSYAINGVSDDIGKGFADATTGQGTTSKPKPKAKTNTKSEYLKIETVKGKPTAYEIKLREEIDALKAMGNLEQHNDLVTIFNKFCGLNRERGKNIAPIFLQEYLAVKDNPEALAKLIQKYKDMPVNGPDATSASRLTNEDGNTNTAAAESSETPASNTDTNTSSTANESTDTPASNIDDNTGNTGGRRTRTTVTSEEQELISVTANIVLEKTVNSNFLTDKLDLTELANIYIKRRFLNKRPASSNPIENSVASAADVIITLLKPGEIRIAEDSKAAFTNYNKNFDIRALKHSIKDLQNEYRAEYILNILKELENSDINIKQIMLVLRKEHGWSLQASDVDDIIKIAQAKQRIKTTGIEDIFFGKRMNPKNANIADNIAKIKEMIPSFDVKKYQEQLPVISRMFDEFASSDRSILLGLLEKNSDLTINLKDVDYWATSIKESGMSFFDAIRYQDILGISIDKLIHGNNTIFDLLGGDIHKYVDAIASGKKLDKTLQQEFSNLINKIFRITDTTNISALKDFYNSNSIERIGFTANSEIDIRFSSKDVSLSTKVEVISKLYKKIFGRITLAKAKIEKATPESFIQELNFQLTRDKNNWGQHSYPNLYKLLGFDSSISAKNLKYIKPSELDFRQEDTIQKICTIITKNKGLDIFSGLHAKLRFIERFVLPKYDGIFDNAKFSALVDQELSKFKDVLKTKKIVIEQYTNTSDAGGTVSGPRCQIDLDEINVLKITFDENGKIRTLFTTDI